MMTHYVFFVTKQTKACLQGVWHLPDNLDAFPSQAQKRTKLPERRYGWVRQRLAEQLHVSIVCRWQKHSVIALILASSRDTKQHSEEQDELRFWSAHERFPLIAPSSRCEEDSSDSWRISTLLPPTSPTSPPSSSTIPPPLSPWPSVRGSSRGLVIPPPPLPGIKFHLTLSLSRGAEGSSKRWE